MDAMDTMTLEALQNPVAALAAIQQFQAMAMQSSNKIQTAATGRLDTSRLHRTAKRNDPCPCGSGRKFKKCCQASEISRYYNAKYAPKAKPRPTNRPGLAIAGDRQVIAVAKNTDAPAEQNTTALAMINAGVSERVVWAYLETGLFVTDLNRNSYPAESIAKWESALAQYDAASEEDRRVMLVQVIPGTPD